MVPTIVGLSVVIVGLTVWVTFLTIALYDIRDTAADAIDAQTTIYMALDGRVKLLEPKEYPKYLGTLTVSEIEADERECETPDPVWGEHDARVTEALTHRMRGKGVISSDPEGHPFFTITPDQSQRFDVDTANRLTGLSQAVKQDNT